LYQVTALRLLLIFITGVFLYYLILNFWGWGCDRNLKKRRKGSQKDQESNNAKVVLIYMFALCIVITLCFLLIRYWSRGVE
jgi:uncharacterized membrane protein YidH (DUF202 family)